MQSYIEIADDIIAGIYCSNMQNGTQIESIPQLCRKYGASDQTVQKALKKLKEEDILFSQPGKGVFVKNREKLNNRKTFLKIAVLDVCTKRFIDEAISYFEKTNPKMKFLWKEFPSTSNLKELRQNYSPDMVIFEESNIYNFMQENILDNIDDPFFLENTYPPLLSGIFSGNKLYAVPLLFSPVLVEYNKKLVKDAKIVMPDKWDMKSFAAIAEKLTKKSFPNKIFGFVLSLSFFRYPALITAFGGNLQDLPNSLRSIEKFLDFSQDLIDKKISPYIPEDSPNDNYRLCFTEGYAAMRFETFVGLRNRTVLPFEWDLMPMPKTDKNSSSSFVADYVGILKDSKNKTFARKFISHLFSGEVQKTIKKEHFLLPARKDVCEDETIIPSEPCPENYYAFKQETRNMQSTWKLFKPEIKKLFSKEMFMFFNEIKTSAESINTIKEKLK